MSLAVDPAFFSLLNGSHERLVGKPLVAAAMSAADGAQWLFNEAEFCVLAHNIAADPIFIYANKAAQRCFEYDWDEITRLPSRLSAEAPDRAERARLFAQVSRDGFVTGYRGLRITKSGRRFWMENGIVWQLIDESGHLHGEAAAFADWRMVPAAG